MSRSADAEGFTLIEMLVALAIFAMIAGGALMLLRFSVDAEARAENNFTGRRLANKPSSWRKPNSALSGRIE